jgi:hypothetical protein
MFSWHDVDARVHFYYCIQVPRLCASRRLVHGRLKAHTNFADESVCLTADNVQNEVGKIHRSQEVLKMLPFTHMYIFRN